MCLQESCILCSWFSLVFVSTLYCQEKGWKDHVAQSSPLTDGEIPYLEGDNHNKFMLFLLQIGGGGGGGGGGGRWRTNTR